MAPAGSRPTFDPPVLTAPLCDLRGPHESCHWVLPGRLIASAYPGHPAGGTRHSSMSAAVVSAAGEGGAAFLCLQEQWELRQKGLQPYAEFALLEAERQGLPRPQFLLCELPDCSVGPDSKLRAALERAAELILKGRLVCVHCFGGKGRTGTFAAAFLGRFCGVNPQAAIKYFVRGHDARIHQGIGLSAALHGPAQVQQVYRLGSEPPGSGAGCGDALQEMPLSW
eukprot:TRINITY_DN2945_c0_g1_i1.p2 TRINITY_DN2945_c0_g1~~TRINITY_DN2945_c0_g1_i1.p2  ORF type:complete len:225 (+),score=70.48 TRINITY_DN2945_c0_g1_i1:75-749(+)